MFVVILVKWTFFSTKLRQSLLKSPHRIQQSTEKRAVGDLRMSLWLLWNVQKTWAERHNILCPGIHIPGHYPSISTPMPLFDRPLRALSNASDPQVSHQAPHTRTTSCGLRESKLSRDCARRIKAQENATSRFTWHYGRPVDHSQGSAFNAGATKISTLRRQEIIHANSNLEADTNST